MMIIGINLPGYAGSNVVKEHYLESISALPTTELTLEAVTTLCEGDEASGNVFLVGHSFGAHTVINMAALDAVNKHNNALNVRGMALLAPVGCRPHKVLRPRESAIVVNLLRRYNPFISAITPHFINAVYTKLLKFPSDLPPGHYIAGLMRAATTGFGVIGDQVKILRAAKLPSLVAWSQNDELMEEEISAELAQMCHFGPRLAFAGGGHNVQKTRAEQVADEMSKWVQEVLNGEEAEMQPTQYLP
ncbi:hypothetical protein V7S43_002076 [Phytophthora oleae]|uniref:AB hydrolase-1 domain-containing protein n=1 Tax=Phytophthora oleae TaxID=2107226 RepID=A0ABD3G2A6_9STRA